MKRNTDVKGRIQLPFLRFTPVLFLMGLICVSCDRPEREQAAITPPTAQPTSAAAAEAWLALLDKGEYPKSWDAGADMFRQEVTKDQWVASLKSVRQPLGDLISRKASSVKELESLPGMPSGSYWVAQFDSSFTGLKSATETVIFTMEKKNEWKAAGYLITPGAPASGAAATRKPEAGDQAVISVLKPIRAKYDVPAMAAAVVTSAGVKFVGVVGVRKRDTELPAELDDLWHLGSDTKAMTSTLIARLVERDQLKWDTTLAKAFRDEAASMHADFQKVTLVQLLSHRAGLPENLKLAEYIGGDVRALRLKAVREELSRKPQYAPGQTNKYSNIGYIVAGAVVEKIVGKTWEECISSEIFGPLQMKTAGFGGTGTPGEIDQPWPHTQDGRPTAENGPQVDNLPVMGPGARVHCSIQDWAKFIQDQLRGARGEKALLKPEAYQTLHTPPFGGDYALGWLSVNRSWGGGKVLNHAGDNTMNFATVWIAPKRDFAILICVNQSGQAAAKAADDATVALIKLVTEKPPVN
jgi:CubicO group peptidase (beta-lactamase class C family)